MSDSSSASPAAEAAEAAAACEDTAAHETASTTTTTSAHSTSTDSNPNVQTAIETLASIITTTTIPTTLPLLLSDTAVSSAISSLLRLPESGAGGNNLCRWLYDTFQSSHPSLQILVLRFVPIIAGLYLSRVPLRRPQAGFEAVLLALYAHETTSRAGQALTVNIPDLSHPSVYHDAKGQARNSISTNLNIAVVSATLEPHGTVRSTRRARIVGVSLELYYSKISKMPRESKLDFCEFCERWAGQNGEIEKKQLAVTVSPNMSDAAGGRDDESPGGGRIHLPWELLQPVLRIIGHCLLGQTDKESDVSDAANRACQSLYLRSLHDINPKAILATGSLLRLREMALDPKNQIDYTEISNDAVISV